MVLHNGSQYHLSFLGLACGQVLRECSVKRPFAASQALSSVKIVSTGTTNFSSTPASARGFMEELGWVFHLLSASRAGSTAAQPRVLPSDYKEQEMTSVLEFKGRDTPEVDLCVMIHTFPCASGSPLHFIAVVIL